MMFDDDELLGILHRFIDDKQKLSINYLITNNNEENSTDAKNHDSHIPIQVSDPFVVRKRGAPSKRLKSSTECNNTASKYKRRALAPLDENLRSKKSIFKESNDTVCLLRPIKMIKLQLIIKYKEQV